MTATYWVLLSDGARETLEEEPPEGLRFTGREPVAPLPPYALGAPAAGRWHQVEDDAAGPELNGRQVKLVTARRGRKPNQHTVITERRLLS